MAFGSEDFYLADKRTLLSQGDIYLAQAAMLWSSDTRSAIPLIPPAPAEPGHTVFAPAWRQSAFSSAPGVTIATSWTPVFVVSHDCEIDKEFNEYVDALVREGVAADEAEDRAANLPELDRYVLVTPLLPYDEQELAPDRWDVVRSGRKIGYFPLAPMPAYEDDEFFVHLSRLSTIERRLLSSSNKVASITDVARGFLRFKLAEVLSSRNISVVSKLEKAIGRRITDVRTLKVKRQDAMVALVLDDDSEIQVMARADLPIPLPERTRKPEA